LTLVETCVALAVAAVLAGVAVPSYLDQLAHGRRMDATSALQSLQRHQESYRRDHGRYAERLEQLGARGPLRSLGGHYRLELRSAGPDSYQLLALAEPSQARDTECQAFSLLVRGAITETQPRGRCWAS
jgi:type IV pilus assembly protein PilE